MSRWGNFINRLQRSWGRTSKKESCTKVESILPLLPGTRISCPLMGESPTFEDQYSFLLEHYRMTEFEINLKACTNRFCERTMNMVMCGECKKKYCDHCIYEWKKGSVVYASFEKFLISRGISFCCIFCFINKRKL